MSSTFQIVTTPKSDTAGTTVLLRTASKHYVFGSQAEGTQRALVQQGARLLKAQDFFLTGKTEWSNMGGLVGMMLTLADASATSYKTSMEAYHKAKAKGRWAQEPPKPHFNIYGPPNLKHAIGTCRRFIFRRGIPIKATEYADKLVGKNGEGTIPPSWQDDNIQVWVLAVSPAGRQQDPEAEVQLEARRQAFDTYQNSFEDHQAPANESPEDRIQRYDRIREATIKFMFDSNWTFDTLVERHISEVQMPAAIFIRNSSTHGYEPYTGPKPGGTEPLPDVKVWTRTPWPGANIPALPPTLPAPECISYIVRSHSSRGAFDAARAKELGIQPGRDFGKLAAGHPVQNKDGEWIQPGQDLGPDKPGQGLAILDVPSVEYLEAIVAREELTSPQIMTGIGAIIWVLGRGLHENHVLRDFMAKLSNMKHIITSPDVSPNRIAYDSVAGQATKLAEIDPARYSIPIHSNSALPQQDIYNLASTKATSAHKGVVVGERGLGGILMPQFALREEEELTMFTDDTKEALVKAMDPDVLHLASAAQDAIKADDDKMQAWKKLLARPDTEITTLGTGSALPSKYRNVSSTLVRVPGVGNYLLDCGENTLGQLSRVFKPSELGDIIRNLRVIWISHLHADHHLGTTSVIRAWYHLVHNGVPNQDFPDADTLASESKEYGLSVISHGGMLQWLSEYSKVEDFGYSRIIPLEISPNDHDGPSSLQILDNFSKNKNKEGRAPRIKTSDYEHLFGFADIQASRVAHCHGAMAVSITFPPSPDDTSDIKPLKVSYSGDCRPSQNFARIGKDTTVLVHEATFDDELRGDAVAKKHSTTSEALGIGSQMNATAVVLTHFSQRYQKIPVLQASTDGEAENPLPDTDAVAEEANEEDEGDVDPTLDNADNMDMHPKIVPQSTQSSSSSPSKKPLPNRSANSNSNANDRVVKIRNPNMKVAIAFDYMRVKIGEIVQMEKFTDALNKLLVTEKDDDADGMGEGIQDGSGGGQINANGKKTSEDEGGGRSKKQKKEKKAKTQRNN